MKTVQKIVDHSSSVHQSVQYEWYRGMERSGLAVCATADRPSLDPAEDVDPDEGGHRDKGHPQICRDEEEIDSLNNIV